MVNKGFPTFSKRRFSSMQDTAETLALQALGWLAANDDLLPVFLGSTGASEADLKTQASDLFSGRCAGFPDDGRRGGDRVCDIWRSLRADHASARRCGGAGALT